MPGRRHSRKSSVGPSTAGCRNTRGTRPWPWAEEEYGIAPPSRQGAYNFSDRMRRQESARRINNALTARAEIGDLAAAAAPDVKPMIDAYMTLGADMALRMNDVKTAVMYTKMSLEIGKQQLERQALDLNRDKFEETKRRLADVEDVTADVALTPAEKEAKLKEIFGL